MKDKLIKYSYNVNSQFGEDGIIEKIFEIIGIHSKVCIEFGAWDGLHFANTANLWKNGWKAILIESNSNRFEALLQNTLNYNCLCLNQFVTPDGQDSLENILERNQIDFNVDLLSIDIDGDDYYILENIEMLKPYLIICEYNPTIPYWIEFVPDKGNNIGCSASSLIRIAESKGYKLVCVTDTNCFFVRNEDYHLFEAYETNIDSIAINKYLTYFITSYDGKYILSQRPVYGLSDAYTGHITGSVYRAQMSTSRERSILRKLIDFLGIG